MSIADLVAALDVAIDKVYQHVKSGIVIERGVFERLSPPSICYYRYA